VSFNIVRLLSFHCCHLVKYRLVLLHKIGCGFCHAVSQRWCLIRLDHFLGHALPFEHFALKHGLRFGHADELEYFWEVRLAFDCALDSEVATDVLGDGVVLHW